MIETNVVPRCTWALLACGVVAGPPSVGASLTARSGPWRVPAPAGVVPYRLRRLS
jgi:hypothetical protein